MKKKILQSLKLRGIRLANFDGKARLEFHNTGLQRSTSHGKPFKLILVEEYSDWKNILGREREIKRWKGGNKFRSLIEGSSTAQRGTTFSLPDSFM